MSRIQDRSTPSARGAIRRALLTLLLTAISAPSLEGQAPFRADWESLARHEEAPEWFRDAKFGIYFHWGVYSVPAFGSEWYPRNMYLTNSREYAHHVSTWGDPAKFGYPDFVPLFRAEKFDAEEWATLFAEAGARFAGPVAEHHDGFSMWDSEVTPWNAMDRGPRRDIVGEMAEAVRRHDMRLVTTFHHARNNLWEHENRDGRWSGHYSGVMQSFPQLLEDPERAILYGYMPREEFLQKWLAKLEEVIDHYHPDIMWFDSWLDEIPDEYKTAYLAHYFNDAAELGKEVVVTFKQEDLPQTVAVVDVEKGGFKEQTDFSWLTDDTMSKGSWSWTTDLEIKPASMVLHSLIDIVSKNGVLLLNVSPRADGTIPEDQRAVLHSLGRWLDRNGEAIYATRPWKVYGHGPTGYTEGRFGGVSTTNTYTAEDIRFTRSKDGRTIYAFVLGRPAAGTRVSLPTFAASRQPTDSPIQSVTLLGSGTSVPWQLTDEGLFLTVADAPLDDMANVFRISLR